MDFRDHIEASGIAIEYQFADLSHYRVWRSVQAGNYSVSIQASESHYSVPRATLPSPFDYVEFEVYTTIDRDVADRWIIPNESRLEFRIEYGSDYVLFPYLPADLVQEWIDYLCSVGTHEN